MKNKKFIPLAIAYLLQVFLLAGLSIYFHTINEKFLAGVVLLGLSISVLIISVPSLIKLIKK